MSRRCALLLSFIVLGVTAAGQATALVFDANVTSDVIFGSGNANGAFTVDQANNVELGLRAKVRFNGANQPENTFNSNGDGTYSFDAGLPPTGFGFAPGSTSTATWNCEWSINSDLAGTGGRNLDQLEYLLLIDFDPSAATNFLGFDPINIAAPDFADHAIGTNATGNGAGTSATDRPGYLALLAGNNLAQNSWNMEFFDGGPFFFDGDAPGIYDFELIALDQGQRIAATRMQVLVGVPEPATALLVTLALAGLRRRR